MRCRSAAKGTVNIFLNQKMEMQHIGAAPPFSAIHAEIRM